LRIAIASGKGGTGKTMLATNLAWLLSEEQGLEVSYVDTDVEEPNGHLFLHPEQVQETRFALPVPALHGGSCSGCGACQRACAYNAILALEDRVMVFSQLCHSCGVCLQVCEERALTENGREMGTIRRGRAGKISFWSARLDVGEARAAPLIDGLLEAVLRQGNGEPRLEILDVPPGTSCSAMAATRDADQVLLVTEPTPFGLHDLELAVEMCQALALPVSVIVNRADLGDGQVLQFCKDNQIPLLAEIPFSREMAVAYARQRLAVREVPAFRRTLELLAARLRLEAGA
jgi:MinD superfamily P-loop ATPase